MPNVPNFTDAQLEQVARLPGDCAAGADITPALNGPATEEAHQCAQTPQAKDRG